MALIQVTLSHGGTEVPIQFAPTSSDSSIKELITDAVNAPPGARCKLYHREPGGGRVQFPVNAQLPAGTYDVEVVQPNAGK